MSTVHDVCQFFLPVVGITTYSLGTTWDSHYGLEQDSVQAQETRGQVEVSEREISHDLPSQPDSDRRSLNLRSDGARVQPDARWLRPA